MSGRVLTLMELATKWGWSRSKLHRLVEQRRIPHLRIGRRRDVHFEEAAAERWLAEQRVEAKAATRTAAPRPRDLDEECAALGIDRDEAFL